ncbi:unnamed protein product [Ascophyllum nodosum]
MVVVCSSPSRVLIALRVRTPRYWTFLWSCSTRTGWKYAWYVEPILFRKLGSLW